MKTIGITISLLMLFSGYFIYFGGLIYDHFKNKKKKKKKKKISK